MKYQIEIGDSKSVQEVTDINKTKKRLKHVRIEASDYENNVIFLARQ